MALITRYVNPGADPNGNGTTSALTSGDNSHAYDSLSAWEAAEQTNLVADGDSHRVLCAGTVADTTLLNMSGWTTGPSNTITIETDLGQSDGRNTGATYSTSHYRLETNGQSIFHDNDYVTYIGVQVRTQTTSGQSVRTSPSGNKTGMIFDGCRICNDTESANSIWLRSGASPIIRASYLERGGLAPSSGNCINNAATNLLLQNNIFEGGGARGITSAADYAAHNNLFNNCDINLHNTQPTTFNTNASDVVGPPEISVSFSQVAGVDAVDPPNLDYRPQNGGTLDNGGTAAQKPANDITGATFANDNIGAFNEVVGGVTPVTKASGYVIS